MFPCREVSPCAHDTGSTYYTINHSEYLFYAGWFCFLLFINLNFWVNNFCQTQLYWFANVLKKWNSQTQLICVLLCFFRSDIKKKIKNIFSPLFFVSCFTNSKFSGSVKKILLHILLLIYVLLPCAVCTWIGSAWNARYK